MKKWITIPMSMIAALLPACGQEDESADTRNQEKESISEKIEDADRLSLISRTKDPSDCGFSNSPNK
jgi:hypothetical protein